MKKKKPSQKSDSPQNRRGTGGQLANGLDPLVGRKTQFQPGESGNPGGRPKRDEAAEIAKAIFEDNGPEIYKAMLKALQSGNSKAFTALADRGYGKVPQHVSLAGAKGGPVSFDIAVKFVKAKA